MLKKHLSNPETSDATVEACEPIIERIPNVYNVLLGCTGSVAAVKVPEILNLLKNINIKGRKADVKVVVTKCSTHFLSVEKIQEIAKVYTDDDEWAMWQKMSDPVLHIELRKWADILIIAPLDANTMAKIANGLCDNLLTCVVRAWDRSKPLIFCPAMNTLMLENPITAKNSTAMQDLGYIEIPSVEKKLACGETGFGGLASPETIVEVVTATLLN